MKGVDKGGGNILGLGKLSIKKD